MLGCQGTRDVDSIISSREGTVVCVVLLIRQIKWKSGSWLLNETGKVQLGQTAKCELYHRPATLDFPQKSPRFKWVFTGVFFLEKSTDCLVYSSAWHTGNSLLILSEWRRLTFPCGRLLVDGKSLREWVTGLLADAVLFICDEGWCC